MNINKIIPSAINQLSPCKKAADRQVPKILSNGSNGAKTLNGLDIIAKQNSIYVNKAADTSDYKKLIEEQIERFRNTARKIEDRDFTFSNGKKVSLTVFEGTKMGSNEAYMVQNKDTGELFYAKFGSEGQANAEVLASKIYKLAGLDVPAMELITDQNGKTGLISSFIPKLTPVNTPKHAVNKGFGVDIFLKNWDAVISNNIQTDGQKLYRIDFGGALNFRALGDKKEFGIVVDELASMLDPKINPQSAKMYSKMTRKELVQSLERVVSIDDKTLQKLCGQYSFNCDVLLKRKEFLSYALEIIKKTPKENLTVLEYLEKVKEQVLTTPLTEFEAYRLKHPEIWQTGSTAKLTGYFKTKFSHEKDYSKTAKAMFKQREILNERTAAALKENGYLSIEEELRCVKNSFGDMNRDIRLGNTDVSSVKDMDSILSCCQIPERITLYRAGTPHDFGGSCSIIDTQKFLDVFYKKGRYFTIPIFPNTTFDRKIVESYINIGTNGSVRRFLYKMNVPAGTNGVYMEKLKGSRIGQNEEEVLLARDLVYRFKDRIPYFTHDEIEVDIVNKVPPKCRVHNFTKETERIDKKGLHEKIFK